MSEQLSGRALDRAIAEELGYTVRWVQWKSAHHAGVDGAYFLFDPQGKQAMEGHQDPFDAWFIADVRTRVVSTPEFHADVNPQLRLCAELGWRMLFTFGVNHEPQVTITTGRGEYAARASTWQEAGARAILAALEAHAE